MTVREQMGLEGPYEVEEEPIVMGRAIPSGTAIIQVDPSKDMAVMELHTQVLGLLEYAEARPVTSLEQVTEATDDLGLLGKLKKAIETKRKEYVDPINAHLKAVNDAFKALVQPLERADVLTRSKIMAFLKEEARKAAEIAEINRLRIEAARKEAALNEGELSEPTQIIEAPAPVPARVHGEASTLGTSTVWKWEVLDFASLPDEYKAIDASKLGKVVRAGLRQIPGVRIYPEEGLRVTSNR